MQISLFDGAKPFKIDKPIRLIELFAGYGSQAFALKYLGADFEHWRTCEWAVKSIQAYRDAHFPDDNTDYSQGFSDEYIYEQLCKWGISANYNEPMTAEQVKRLGVAKQRQIFSNIVATRNLVNIQQVHGEDLGIEEKDKYCYVMTYSFPCQDLSLAGKGAGMEKGGGTRSGMLWEVERILDECNDLPQVLLMENVPEVIGTNNIKHFAKWLEKLESLGYHCYWKVLNAKDFGVPQNRERCFMVSILGDYYYEFPEPIKLERRLKDLLEENVDEKYYLSDKMLNYCFGTNQKESKFPRGERFLQSMELTNNKGIATTITTNAGNRVTDNFIKEPKVLGGIGEKKSNGGTQWYQQDRVYDDNVAISVTTSFNPFYAVKDYRIRKLTPKECFRLMGVRDEDYEKIAKNQSNASLYHLAGDSIVVDVLMAIFKQIL